MKSSHAFRMGLTVAIWALLTRLLCAASAGPSGQAIVASGTAECDVVMGGASISWNFDFPSMVFPWL
jgi:hypothetical protein